MKRKMDIHKPFRPFVRSGVTFLTAALLVVSMGGATIVGPIPINLDRRFLPDMTGTQTLRDMQRLGFLKQVPQSTIEELLAQQAAGDKSFSQILKDPKWRKKLGLNGNTFRATWYAANPYDLLPVDLQIAIKKSQKPFTSRAQIKKWLAAMDAPQRWYNSIELALIETTPINLWRASRGLAPFAKNGQVLEPILVEKSDGHFEIQDGHIATDPRVIPTNSRVILLVRVNGVDHILKVKAADIGQAIQGRHVDLPISLKPRYGRNHAIRFPGEYIRNPTVMILSVDPKFNPNRKG